MQPERLFRSGSRVVFVSTGAMACSVACAMVLHGAPSRSDAWVVAIIAILWGVWTASFGRVRAVTPAWVVGVALMVRLPLIGTPPLLSDDLYRYLWEGLALNAGHNPFLLPPAGLPGLDDALRARVNHPDIPSIYPPLALWWFRLLAGFGTVVACQLATCLVDVGVTIALVWTRAGRHRDLAPALVYALHPLPVLESSSSAHLEHLALLFAVLAIRAHDAGAGRAALALLWAGVATKLFPVVLLPTMLASRGRRDIVVLVGLGSVVTLALAAPVWEAGLATMDALRAYTNHWSFNGLLYPWLAPWLGGATRPLLLVLGGVVCVLATLRYRDPAWVWLVTGTAFVALSPTVHPWYVAWALVPALVVGERGWPYAATALLGSYAVLRTLDPATGAWQEQCWLWWVTWPPALGALGWSVQRRSAAKPTAA